MWSSSLAHPAQPHPYKGADKQEVWDRQLIRGAYSEAADWDEEYLFKYVVKSVAINLNVSEAPSIPEARLTPVI